MGRDASASGATPLLGPWCGTDDAHVPSSKDTASPLEAGPHAGGRGRRHGGGDHGAAPSRWARRPGPPHAHPLCARLPPEIATRRDMHATRAALVIGTPS
jgi:hypothetical protein